MRCRIIKISSWQGPTRKKSFYGISCNLHEYSSWDHSYNCAFNRFMLAVFNERNGETLQCITLGLSGCPFCLINMIGYPCELIP